MVLHVQCVAHDDATLFPVVCAIRQRVFLEEYGLKPEEDTEPCDFHATTLHFVGFDTDLQQFVAVARSVMTSKAVVQLGRIAVLPEARGRGHGVTMMQFVKSTLLKWDDCGTLSRAFLFSIPEKRAFYERCGFVASGESEVVRGLLLHEMVLHLQSVVPAAIAAS